VTVGNIGSITTTNDSATAIFAQSVGGGETGEGSSLAGDISITVTGDIKSSGEGARATFAQSVGGDGNGTINIEVGPDSVVTTIGPGYETVSLLDGKDNVLTNYGVIEKTGAVKLGRYFLITEGGALAIENHGTLSGSISLDDDFTNTLTNHSDGILKARLELDLGTDSASSLINHGLLTPAPGNTVTTALTGSLVQSATGTLAIDLNHGDTVADRIDVTGTVDMSGAVDVTIDNVQSALPAANSLTIVSADGGVSNATQSNLSVASTAVVAYGLSYPTELLPNRWTGLTRF
jgi:hypothetical protein